MQKLEKKLIFFKENQGELKTVTVSGNEPGQWHIAPKFRQLSWRSDDISKPKIRYVWQTGRTLWVQPGVVRPVGTIVAAFAHRNF